MADFAFHLDTPIAKGIGQFFRQLEQRLELDRPVTAFLAGGMAVHLYVAKRVTTDIDAEFSSRIAVPPDLIVQVALADGSVEDIYFDGNFNTTLGLMHEDYQLDAVSVPLGLRHLTVRVLSPVDLAVSKIARLANPDREDIHDLVAAGLTSADEIQARAEAAIGGFIGKISSLRLNLRDALALARRAEQEERPSAKSR
jgi:hypothetical protein